MSPQITPFDALSQLAGDFHAKRAVGKCDGPAPIRRGAATLSIR